jgi:hypothetical protein
MRDELLAQKVVFITKDKLVKCISPWQSYKSKCFKGNAQMITKTLMHKK